MHIDLLFSPLDVNRIKGLKNNTSIIIDVLRACTTMIYAFNGYDNTTNALKGIKQIKPAKDVETAFKLHKLPENAGYMLAGEKGGFPPEGFDFGNSPREFTINKINNASLIMATTNGTKILNLLKNSDKILIGSFVNARSIATKSLQLNKDIIIGCAGREHVSGLEDITCGGLIIKHVLDQASNFNIPISLSDSAKISIKTYDSYNSVLDILNDSFHGKSLIEIGMEKDLLPCSKTDIFKIVPSYNNGIITPEIID